MARTAKTKKTEVINENTVQAEEKPVKETRRTSSRRRVQIPKDVECVVMSLCNGELVYRDRRTSRLFEFPELGDSEIMTIEELSTMKNLARKFFKNSYITVVDVLDDEYTLEDVYEYLQIKTNTEILCAEDMDDIILDMDIDDFRTILQNRKEGGLRQRIVERAIKLYEDGEFNDYSKMKIIKDVTKLDYLFE